MQKKMYCDSAFKLKGFRSSMHFYKHKSYTNVYGREHEKFKKYLALTISL